MAKDIKKNSGPNPVLLRQEITTQGPLPSSQEIAAYNKILPDAAERLFRMAEREQEMTHSAIKKAMELEERQQTTVRWVIVPAIFGGFILALCNRDPASYGILVSELVLLVGALYNYSKNKKK